MFDYSPKVVDHFLHPRHLGQLTERDIDRAADRLIVADAGHVHRGDALRLSLRIRKSDDRIVDARFQNFGTGMPIASASHLCERIIGKTLGEALSISAEDLSKELDGLPELKLRQPVLVLDALDGAARMYRGQAPRERGRPGEQPLCTCFQVPESVIERAIRLRGLKTVDEITHATTAGGGCHTCHPELEEILERCARKEYKVHIPADEYYAAQKLYGIPPPDAEELLRNPKPPPARDERVAADGFVYPDKSPVAEIVSSQAVSRKTQRKPWKDLDREERMKWIEEVLEYDLRPAIRTDGGDIKLLDLKDNRVLVSLHGHCQNCHSALSTLKMGVEKRLQEAVWPELEIEEVYTP
jgi:NifU-like protein